MSEPTFVVPLSALVDLYELAPGMWRWTCMTPRPSPSDTRQPSCEELHTAPYQAEAESAAIEHLAEVHGLTVQDGNGAMDRLLKIVEWLEMATTDPTVPSCVIESELDQHGRELRSVYEELRGGDR